MSLLAAHQLDTLSTSFEQRDGLRVSTTDVDFDPFDFARTGAKLVDRAVAYSMPNGDRLVGLGTAWRAEASGVSRFSELRNALDEVDLPNAKAFVGFSFLDDGPTSDIWAGYSAAEVLITRITIERFSGRSRLTVVVPDGDDPGDTLDLVASMEHPSWGDVIDSGDHGLRAVPSVTEWMDSVEGAVGAIAGGELEKVVLSRTVVVESSKPVEILRVFRELVQAYPQSYAFAWKAHDAVFMGASPELLVNVQGDQVRSNPLAGSTARGEGRDSDAKLADDLMASRKNRMEHQLVVDDVTSRLEPLTSHLDVPEHPSLKALATVQHLSTDIRGKLLREFGLLDVVAALHPTPAVGGVPLAKAMQHIEVTESIDRGWYTGGVGWLNAAGDGAVCIALRCGLVRGRVTHLYAGAGIVADSEPESEVAETRLKFKPLLDVLTRN